MKVRFSTALTRGFLFLGSALRPALRVANFQTATSTNERAWVRGRRRSRQNPNLSKEVFLRRQPNRNLPRKLEKKPVNPPFRETREMLLLAYDGKIISDEEFLVLWESCCSKNPDFSYSSYARFD